VNPPPARRKRRAGLMCGFGGITERNSSKGRAKLRSSPGG
jgi:hypothetical protein